MLVDLDRISTQILKKTKEHMRGLGYDGGITYSRAIEFLLSKNRSFNKIIESMEEIK